VALVLTLVLALVLTPPGHHAIRARALWLQCMFPAIRAGHRGQATGRGKLPVAPVCWHMPGL